MSDSQLIIVLAAMSALISVVAIAIDWVGKPLRHKRFVPKIFRYEDEEFVATTPELETATAAAALHAHTAHLQYSTAPSSAHTYNAPLVTPTATSEGGNQSSAAGAFGAAIDQDRQQLSRLDTQPNQPIKTTPEPTQTATPAAAAYQDRRQSTETDTGTGPNTDTGSDTTRGRVRSQSKSFSDAISEKTVPAATGAYSSAKIATTEPIESIEVWDTTMPLDVRVQDKLPTLADKAARFWKARGADPLAEAQFGLEALPRMAEGKAPQRRNPRTTEYETPDVFGLRSASRHEDVQIRWPTTSKDPWSS